MADGVFNIAKGHVNDYVNRIVNNDPENSALIIVMLKASEADAVLQDYDDLGALLGAGGNTEANFTNYERFTLTDAADAPSIAVDDTNNRKDADFPDLTITSAGGASNNALTKALVCYDSDTGAGTDANIIPLTYHDFAVTTNGNDLILQVAAAGFYQAA